MFRRVFDYDDYLFSRFFNDNIFPNVEEILPKKKDDTYKYSIDLPGVKKEDIDIGIDSGKCVISAIRKKDEQTYNISRYINLPKYIDKSEVSATLEDGVLVLSFKERIPEEKKLLKVKIE